MITKNIKYSFLLALLYLFVSCNSSNNVDLNTDVTVIPIPKNVIKKAGSFNFIDQTTVVIDDSSLLPIAEVLTSYVERITGKSIKISSNNDTENNIIIIKYNKDFKDNTYTITVDKTITLEANSFGSITNAVATLVQLIKINEGGPYIPYVTINDGSDLEYRAVMLDLARFWHPIETIKETIDLLWLYKIPYLQLHLSDNRRFTFPLKDFPKLNKLDENGNREYYTKEELKDIVEYAKDRGIAIIPEVDLPGHSEILWQTYPEVFGSLNSKTNKPEQLYVVNIAKENTYKGVNTIIKELASVFYTSPFIHVGGDEVYLDKLKNVPEYQKYTKENGLTAAANGDPNELFCHFINKMNAMVKATGKKTIAWEGFHGIGAGNVVIDKDITIIVWNTTYNSPNNLLDNGYKIINSTWIPWYMVGAMNLAPSLERAYNWEVTDWAHWNTNIEDIKVSYNSNILGGQISYWEQNHFKVIPVLKDRVPVLAERLWNKTATKGLEAFKKDISINNKLYTKLFRPIPYKLNNLDQAKDLKFVNKAQVVLDISNNANYSWSFSKSWYLPSKDKMSKYKEPIELTNSGVLTLQKEDEKGKVIGYPVQTYYQKIVPAYVYKVYGPAPIKGWDSIPDFSNIPLIREGVTAKITEERLDKINKELFAKVKREGHIDTRFADLYNPYLVELKSTIEIKKEISIILKLQTNDGLANVYIDDVLIAKGTEFNNKPEEFTAKLSKGEHKVKIVYFYKHIQNQLNIMYKSEEMENFVPFENLIQPLNF
ncbi:family 20 glycosylhydrolase [Cellulophaga fucicola]|uniref:family 20 glycosylhydrolase n=1 Tax=Cellulophaga fucicola TaxID=76595 RepID=UPI003EBA4AC5